jgi:hypothetical protein
VAATRTRRHYLGFDTDEAYAAAARARVAEVAATLARGAEDDSRPWRLVERSGDGDVTTDDWAEAVLAEGRRDGLAVKDLAALALATAGFTSVARSKRTVAGVQVPLTAVDALGQVWRVEVVGHLSKGSDRTGLRPTDALLRTVGRATVLSAADPGGPPLLVLATDVPPRGTPGAKALKAVVGPGRPIRSLVHLLDPAGLRSLHDLAEGRVPTVPAG